MITDIKDNKVLKQRSVLKTLIPLLLLDIATVHAGTPVWTFTPLTATTITVTNDGTATIQYRVQNNSSKPKNIVMQPVQGITQTSPCVLAPAGNPQSSCTLSLAINGANIPATGVLGGPVLCQADSNGNPNPNQCAQPSRGQTLAITKGGNAPTQLSFAVAAGYYDDTNFVLRPLLVTTQSSTNTWVYPTAINDIVFSPINTNPFAADGYFQTASCSGTICISGGQYGDNNSIYRPLLAVSQDSGVTWTYPTAINEVLFTPGNPNPFVDSGIFQGSSCSGNICIAAGYYYDGTTNSPLLAVTQDSANTWTYPASINTPVFTPVNAHPFNSFGEFNGASCNGTICIAVGRYSDATRFRAILALSQDSGTTWSYPTAITEPVFTPDNTNSFLDSGFLKGGSCSGNTCIAAGRYLDNNAKIRPFLALTQNAGTLWTFPSSINAPVFTPDNTLAFNRDGDLTSASCAGTTCIAVGNYLDTVNITRPLIAVSQNSGTTWIFPSSINAPIFTPDNTNAFLQNGSFKGASCSGTTCIAAGEYQDVNMITRPLLAISKNSGTTWTYPSVTNAPVFTPDNTNAFNNGSFASANCNQNFCIAAGEYNDSSVRRPLLAVSMDAGTTWTFPSSINAPVFTPMNINPFNDGEFYSSGVGSAFLLPNSLRFLLNRDHK